MSEPRSYIVGYCYDCSEPVYSEDKYIWVNTDTGEVVLSSEKWAEVFHEWCVKYEQDESTKRQRL